MTTATTATTALEVREVYVPPALTLELEMTASSPADIGMAMGKAFSTLMNFVHGHTLVVAGPPRAIYQSWNGTETRFTAAIPIVDAPSGFVAQDVKVVSHTEQQALRFTHHGAYKEIPGTYSQIDAWLRERGAVTTEADWTRYFPMWEEYIGDPATTPEQELMTYIFLPLH